ncbi:hypothetical protein SISSUDRAFT_1061681 [Sistotremastrum suecicum HHB10207 ss-3]|uniref:Uncharacterized protein n=1 Tax=Sistotremastrum suecicum HHB10207 ss-3 TaxID=1314776 RepID=A0A166DP77_9AGAM|nr:hypothetical protein SISSUDRAFT_1061681 [Sistotremastrum suecicum HHB10207 ss-3]
MDALWIDGLIDGRSDTPAYKGSSQDRIAPETSMTASPKRVEFVDDVAKQESCSASIQRRAVSHKNSLGSPPPYPLPPTPYPTFSKPVIVQLDDGSETPREANDASDPPSSIPPSHSLPLWAKAFDPLTTQLLSRSESSNSIESELERELFQGLKFLDGPFPAISRSVSSIKPAAISAMPTTSSSRISVRQKPSPRLDLTPAAIQAVQDKSASPKFTNESLTLPLASPTRPRHACTPSDTSTGATISTVIQKVTITSVSRSACLPSSPSLPLFASPISDAASPSLLDDLHDMSADFEHITNDWGDSFDAQATTAEPPSTWIPIIRPAEDGCALPNRSQIRTRKMRGSEVAVMRLTQYLENREQRDTKDCKRRGKIFSR